MYRPDTRFEFYGIRFPHRREDYLHAYWEVCGDPMSDNYTPHEINAKQLFERWARYAKERYPDGQVPIYWFVVGKTVCEYFPGAPLHGFSEYERHRYRMSFLYHFTEPTVIPTGEPIQWTRLYVVDKLWHRKRADKGGFIQSATGWKPHILQPYVDLNYLLRLAQEYDPMQAYRAARRGAFPLMYQGYQFRSALEVRWAHFLDALGWEWQYEPNDFGTYIPDFFIAAPHRFYLEVKPAHALDELQEHTRKIDRSLPLNARLLLVGAHYQVSGYAGLLRERKGHWRPVEWQSLTDAEVKPLWAQAHRATQWQPQGVR